MKTIVFVGDSITEGAGDDERGGWTRRVEAWLPAGMRAIHAGISGNTIVDVLQRLDRDVLAHNPGIIVLAIGINDSRQYPVDGGRYGVSPQDFAAGLAEFANRVKPSGAAVFVVGLNPVDETQTGLFEVGMIYASKAQRLYDEALQSFANDNGYEYIAIEPSFAANGGAEALTTDGLHPNPAGHALIAQAVWAKLEGALTHASVA
jgi:lysophospholipase L1-like esterase